MGLEDIIPNPSEALNSTIDSSTGAFDAMVDVGSKDLSVLSGDSCDILGSVGSSMDSVTAEKASGTQALIAGTMTAVKDVSDLGQGMFDDIATATGPVFEQADAIASGIVDQASAAYDAAVDAGDELLQAQIIADTQAAITDQTQAATDFAADMATEVGNLTSDLSGEISGAIAAITPAIDAMIPTLGQVAGAQGVASCPAAQSVIAEIGPGFSPSLDIIGDVGGSVAALGAGGNATLPDVPVPGVPNAGSLAAVANSQIDSATSAATGALNNISSVTPPALPPTPSL